MHSKQQQIEILFHMLKKKTYKNWTCEMRKMQFIFFVPSKMKVKGYMYPQMKKPVGMPSVGCTG
jgi:hypothetical protein